MPEIKMSIPDRMLVALEVDAEGMAAELRMAAAMKIYELGRLSSGAAAELAGVPRCLFLQKLGEYGIATFNFTEDELRADIENARRCHQ